MKLTPAQKKLENFLKEKGGTVYGPEVNRMFDRRVVDSMVSKGVMESVGRSYLRQDDMEMVYYHEYRLADKTAELRERKEALLAELKKVQEKLGDEHRESMEDFNYVGSRHHY
jgi:hypothetical protein